MDTVNPLLSACALAAFASLLGTTIAPAGGVGTTPSPSAASTIAPTIEPVAPFNDDRPNVVYFLVDDMRADDLAYMPKTRRLIGQAGMTFTESISPHPMCCPARAEILTGQYAQNNGVQHNEGRYGGYEAFNPSQTLATWLDDAGYQTAFHGKHLNHYQGRNTPRDPGWDIWDPLTSDVYAYTKFGFFNGDTFENDYLTTRLEQRANASVRQFAANDAPFFVEVNHLAPHHRMVKTSNGAVVSPPVPEPKYAKMFADAVAPSLKSPSFNEADVSDKPANLRLNQLVDPAEEQKLFLARIRSLQSVDDAVESMIATLKETGELGNTYIVFTSDNGYALGEHRYTQKNKLSREILRVPMLIAGPGISKDDHSDRIVTLVDLTATVVEITNAKPTLPIDGASFLSHVKDQKDSGDRDTTLIQTGDIDRVGDRYQGWAYRGVQTQRYLYGRDVNEDGYVLLYDRLLDPNEMRNVADDPAYLKIREELWHRTRVLMDCSGSNCNQTFGVLPRPKR